MIKFRLKDFTISEGHYTGPKDMQNVPSTLELLGKGAIGGAAIGGIVGKVSDLFKKDEDSGSEVLLGMETGGKIGAISGILMKFFLNYLHNPMSTLLYNDVDRTIRKKFGVYRTMGVTLGDTLDKRANIDERFSFNDRNVVNYKINISVLNNQLTMYTYNLTTELLNKVSSILDYYCKKYYSVDYSSFLINLKLNSYAVEITFTNYNVIGNFLMEISQELSTKINLLDNKAVVNNRLMDAAKEYEQKSFSNALCKTYKISFLGNVQDISKQYGQNSNTKYLELVLNKLHYNNKYTKGKKESDINFIYRLSDELFIIIIDKQNNHYDDIDNIRLSIGLSKGEGKKVSMFFVRTDLKKLEFVIKKLMQTGIKPNIFEK